MFKNMFDYSYVRSAQEAVGFYIVHLLLIFAGGFIAGFIIGFSSAFTTLPEYMTPVNAGSAVAIIMCLVISYLILKAKGLLSSMPDILLVVASGILAAIGGGLLGLVPAAYLTTRK